MNCSFPRSDTWKGAYRLCAENHAARAHDLRPALALHITADRRLHEACILNELGGAEKGKTRLSPLVAKEVADMGIPKRARARWLKNVRMQQIATLLSLYVKTVPEGRSFNMAATQLDALFARAEENREILPLRGESATAGASLDFVKRLTYGFGVLG